ncbi:HD domain-containing protein [Desulfosporosinus metallidurans]|uniref:Chaperone protein HtpG n=1 Tax=Desulfosporosinus metallidurans TaxID=1888891 RepID=A0A1Q8QFL4_9FIRM|nr:ATP-binding protein [Desulfosporosinus metallidurans]OLN26105.1 Chaperone protein HtpG [Desulfosporosinus metallidurans]
MDINDSKLYKILIDRQSEFLPNIKNVFDYAKDLLPQVINVFSNYTQHDVDHSIMLTNYMYDIIDDITQMNDLEITMMIYSALLHDIGMVVTDKEITRIRQDDPNIIECKYSVVLQALKDDKLALQECIRPIHAKRSAYHIANMDEEKQSWFVLPNSTNINFDEDMQKICQSHNESFQWLKTELEQDNYKGNYSYNAQYIALLLRLSDLLDIDENRTPMHLYQLINPEGFGDLEWRQHFIIANTPKIYINETTKQKVIRLYGESSDPKVHRKLLKYIDYINQELLDAINLSDTFQNKKYAVLFKSNIENKIQTKTFTFSDFRLDLDYNAVTKLLMGEHIYGEKRYGLRELVQNSIDACMLMKEVSQKHKDYQFEKYQPYINIIFNRDKKEVMITDNGVGMSLDILKKYFLNVGVSYYSSSEYKYKGYTYNPIGNYGIGFLSCFMLSSNVNVESKRYDDQKLNKIELERNSEYICLTQEQSTRMQGTDIILDLEQFAEVFPDVKKTKEFIELNFVDCSIPIKILNYENGNTSETPCELIGLKENSDTIARLDKYLNNIEGYVELNCKTIGCVDTLEDFDGDTSYVYICDKDILVQESEIELNINDFVHDGQIAYLKVPIISKEASDKFNNFLDVLDDFDEAINKLSDVDYLEIFCTDEDELVEETIENSSDSIIGEYCFENLCREHGHSSNSPTRTKKVSCLAINDDINKVLLYEKSKGFGQYSWIRTDKVFIKNVLIPDFSISIPSIINGINLKSALFNIKNKAIIPNVSRNNVQKSDTEKFSYAVGKAIHLWALDNVKLEPSERVLLNKFISKCYSESNEFIS